MEAYVAPVSHAQRRLWFLDRLEPGNVAYNVSAAVRLRGDLNVSLAERAIGSIIARHDALRTVFAVEDGSPVQMVRDSWEFTLPEIHLDEGADLAALLSAEGRRPFDLASGPLFRALLIRVAAGDHVLLLTLHHIVADGWSMGILVREFSEYYRALVYGEEPQLPELPIQFPDFVDWQNETLSTEALEAQLRECSRRLAGAPLVLDLPADFPRPAEQSYRGDLVLQSLPPGLTENLKRVAARENATLFMALLAVFETLLLRCSRQDHFLVGTPVAGRSHPDTEGLIGFFVNTLALRADLHGDPTFLELLARVREECVTAFSQEEVPFDRVVDAVQPERDRSRTPLFQTYFTLQNAPRETLKLPGLEASVIEVNLRAARVDLTLGLEETLAGLAGRWEYCTDVFSRDTVARWAGMFEMLCEAVAADPARRVSELPLLTQSQRAELIALGGSQREVPVETLPEWFARTAAQFPDRSALIAGDVGITYRELDRRSNQVARHLRQLGAGPETRVGISFSRSRDLVIAILGVLKAGAAYVPIDPEYPRERIDFMLADSGITIVLESLADAGIESASSEPLDCTVTPDNAAYVIYTSGSTGKPKGCVVTHANVTRLMRSTEGWFAFDSDDVWTLFHSFAFDFSVWEIWGALLYGGRLVVVPYEVSRSPEAFHQLLETEGVTVLNQTPSAFRQLIAVDRETKRQLRLRYVVFGGEALELSMLAPWIERHGDANPQLINMYGITETTVHVTWRRILRADLEARRGSVIGVPLPDLSLYVVDGQMEPVPIGVPGEIVVGGAGLARGYLGQPELTAQRFVANPFGAGRLYRSGDLARRLPDGGLEYLGRMDQQVKIRGFRIELGEIERVLSRLPGVREVAVIARSEDSGEKRLVAYLAGEPANGARELCRAWLPDYMVPAAFVFLDALPLTEHGKLDRRALPAPDLAATSAEEYVAPQTEVEVALAGIWERVLGISRIGLNDNFFVRGGDSILTIQVVTQARQAGFGLSVKDMFERQTLGELAAAAAPVSAVSASPAAPETNSYPLSPMQAGMLFQSLLEPDRDVYFEQVSGDIRGVLNADAFRSAWQGLMDRHAILRTSFQWKDAEEPFQIVNAAVGVDWTAHDWTSMPEADRAAAWKQLLAADRQRGFAFDQAPLWRVNLVRLGEDSWRWLWSHFHALLDGWSLPLVFQDVLADYEYLANGTGSRPREGTPYRSYVEWIRAQDRALAEQYWRRELAGFDTPSPLVLPGVKRAPEASDGEFELRFGEDQTSALRDWTRRHGLTLNTLFQGAWALVLSRYGAGRDVVFGVTVSGRPPDLSGADKAIGLFINTLPMRVTVDHTAATLPWLQGLQQAQASMRQFEYTALSDIHAWSDLGGGVSLFDTILVFENYPADDLLRELPSSLRLENLRTAERTNYLLTAAVLPGREIALRLHFDARRLEAQPVERMLRAWRCAVENIVRGEIGFVFSNDARTLLEWGENSKPFGAEQCIHEIVAAHAERDPGASALLAPGREISYAEMMTRARDLAAELHGLGVGLEVPVAVCMEKCPEMVISWLAVLMAGGAFVPLDPQFASARLAGVMEDARPAVMILHQPTAWVEPLANSIPVVWADRETSGGGASARVPQPSAANLAYIIHTSGSTGRPKGVMLSHAGLRNLAQAQAAICGIEPGRRGLQFASVSFDAAVSEVFMALVSGAAIWLEPRDQAIDPAAFAAMMRSARIDHATIPPALLQMLAPEEFPVLRTLLVAGEAATEALYRAWAQDRQVFNAYGPTEITVCATMELVSEAAPVTLGRPIANATVYVVDEFLSLVPIGAPGEIVAGGAGVARGYLNRPDLTADRFVPDPFSAIPGARLYRTGDLGRWTGDGRLEFLGRADRQVKVRGHRVEPAEVEAALIEHEDVADAVVLAQKEEGRGSYLAAFALARADAEPRPSALLEHLRQRLPDYLTPRSVSVVREWPLTSAGKIDRRALSQLAVFPETPPPDESAWRNDIERQIAAIWSEVLRVPHIGPDQNFFEAGGDSILSLQIVARAHRAGLILTPRQIFGNPTIRRLAAVAEQRSASGVAEIEATGPIPLTPIQHWFFDQQQEEPHHWNQSLMLELRDASMVASIGPALAAVIRHHSSFRLRFRREADGSWTQFYAAQSETADENLPVFPEPAMHEAMASLQASLNLETGPLWRAAIFERKQKRPLLFILVHHLEIDGVSWRILAEDLASACLGAAELPPATASFGRWARALATYAASQERQAELPFWSELASVDADLPCDFDPRRARNDAAHADTVSVQLDATTTESLLREAGAAYRLNTNELLLAALSRTLANWTGRPEHLISIEGHGREELSQPVDITRTTGWFTSIFPCRLECRPFETDAELLKSTKEQLRAIPDKGLGFGILRYLSPDAEVRGRLASVPSPRVSFNYLGQTDQTLGPDSPFSLSSVPVAFGNSPRATRAHWIDINAMVAEGVLRVDWIFGEQLYRRATIEKLAGEFIENIRQLTAHCLSPDAGAYTPSDFQLARLSAVELDAVLEDLAETAEHI